MDVYCCFRDEKTVLLNQISTLQSQQVALGSRVESLTQTSENAMAREREAEDRLDAVLSQHARQISQRQVRFSKLFGIVSFVIIFTNTQIHVGARS